MIQDELIEKLARKLCETDRHDDTPWEQCSSWWKLEYLQQAKRILALIKETLPELAKEAGYVKLADLNK